VLKFRLPANRAIYLWFDIVNITLASVIRRGKYGCQQKNHYFVTERPYWACKGQHKNAAQRQEGWLFGEGYARKKRGTA